MASIDLKRRKKWKKTKPYNSPKPEDLKLVAGSWKVSKVLYESFGSGAQGTNYSIYDDEEEDGGVLYHQVPRPDYQGVEVVFDDQCDVIWSLPKGVEPIPLFQTTSYNIDGDSLDLIGGVHGRTFHFQVEERESGDVIYLKTPLDNCSDGEEEESEVGGANNSEEIGDMIIVLDKVKECATTEEGFSLKDALLEGYFSDLSITSTDGQIFNIHRTILSCTSPQMSYREWEVFLRTLKSPILSAVLNYIYSGALPTGVDISLVKELLTAVSGNPKLSQLVNLCRAFIGSHDLKQRLLQLIDDIQASIELGKKMVENTDVANPVKVTYAIKQLAREAAVAVTKFGLLCELYTRNKKEMKKSEKQEVLEYLRARVVVFVDQMSELLDLALDKYHSLSEEQRAELATYIIPEVERLWDLLNVTCGDSQAAVIAGVTSLTKRRKFNRREVKLSVILQFVAHGGELKKLQRIGKEFAEFVVYSQRKREEFRDLNDSDKVEKIIRGMSALKREGVGMIKELNEAKEEILLHNALDWKKFKILVAVCCSYATWSLRKLQALKSPLTPVLLKACKFIQRPEVVDALVYFDLLDTEDLKKLQDSDEDDPVEVGQVGVTKLPSLEPLETRNSSQLAHGCLKLLQSLEHSDMQFVLQQATPPGQDRGVASTPASEPVVIEAHRVIVSARCEWLKRALMSGMREAIDKQISIYGCDVVVFQTFLKYLYSGALDTESMSLEELIEVLAVADQYQTTSLRLLCEGVLISRVSDTNVFFLLQVADRFSTMKLREATLQHIIDNHDVIMTQVDGYSSLPDELKEELRSLLSTNDPALLLRHNYRRTRGEESESSSQQRGSGCGHTDSAGSEIDSSGSFVNDHNIPSATNTSTAPASNTANFKMDPEFHDADTMEFQSKLEQLRAFVGSEASEELLKDFLLAADMDINRAANFYFNTQTGE